MAKNCEKCKSGLDCDVKNELAKKAQPVDYIVHEGILWRMERTQKRLVAIILVLIALLAASWIGFFIYESQFEDVSVTNDISQDTDGGGNNNYSANIVSGDFYGETTNQANNQNTQKENGR